MGATIKDCQNLVELAFEKRREVHMQVQAAKKAVKSRLMFNAIEDAEISVTCKEIQDSSLFDVVASDLATEQGGIFTIWSDEDGSRKSISTFSLKVK